MPIYTRVGDGGFTQLPRKGDEPLRLPKHDARIAALGELDEFNAHIGWCLATCIAGRHDLIQQALSPVQADLFRIGASLVSLFAGGDAPVRVELTQVSELEKTIDRVFAALGPLTHFILPGGSELASRLHVTRTVCRRAERAIVLALQDATATDATGLILRYLNRLSDLLFALSRQANRDDGAEEKTWQP